MILHLANFLTCSVSTLTLQAYNINKTRYSVRIGKANEKDPKQLSHAFASGESCSLHDRDFSILEDILFSSKLRSGKLVAEFDIGNL